MDKRKIFTKIIAGAAVVLMLFSSVGSLIYYLIAK